MRLFLKISLITLMFSCASYYEHNNFEQIDSEAIIHNPYFSDPDQDYIYKAGITVYERQFGGILVVKKIGVEQHRIVFTTEMGNKIFDFTLKSNEFIVNEILKDFDKGLLIKLLKRDFMVLVTEKIEPVSNYSKEDQKITLGILDGKAHYYFEREHITKIVRAKHRKEKVTFLFRNISDNIAKEIDILHANIPLEIKLKAIF